MKRQYIHDLYSSFILWMDHILANKGEAYFNVNSPLYPMKDDVFRNASVYGSPYKSWVYDSSITGAMIPSGVYSNGNFIPRGQSGLKLDFNNGRILFSGGINIPVSGQFAPKEFNIYTTTQSDEELVFETRIDFASQFPIVGSGIPSDKIVCPGIFVRVNTMQSEPFAFGGEYNTIVPIRAIILSDSTFKLNGVGNLFVDEKENNFLVFSQTPINEFGDLKTGYYSYNDYLNQYFDNSRLAYLEDIDFSTMTAVNNTQNPDMRIGFLDFNVQLPRFPV